MICDNILEEQISKKNKVVDICRECHGKMVFVCEPRCKKCGKPLNEIEKEYCGDCVRSVHFYDYGLALYHYDENIKRAIYKFKYKNYRIYSEFFGQQLAKHFEAEIRKWKPDALIPVPIHSKRKRFRGYNQSKLLADEISKNLNLPVDDDLLIRTKHTIPQKELSHILRKKNIENAFKIERNIVKYKCVVIVDDIYTTGSTIDECSKILKGAGIEKVYFLALSVGFE